MELEIASALISGAATLASAGVAAWLVMHQIKKQGEISRDEIALTEKMKINLGIYTKLLEICDKSTDANSALTAKLTGLIASYIRIWQNPEFRKYARPKPPMNALELRQMTTDLAYSTINAVVMIESWVVIDPRISVFQTAFNVAIHDISSSADELFELAVPMLHVELDADGQPAEHPAPPEAWVKFDELINKHLHALGVLDCFIADFRTELQNLLIAPLYQGNLAPQRKPIDPKYILVTLEQSDELETYFSTQTAWGRSKIEAEKRAISNLQPQPKPQAVAKGP